MPASRQRSRSPAMALAVSAMMRGWAGSGSLRMRRVASKPSITGIITSIKTTSKGVSVTISTASRPLPTTVAEKPMR